MGVLVTPNFQHPIAAKPCVGYENMFWRCKYHYAKFGGGQTSRDAGGEKVVFLLPAALRAAQRRYFGYSGAILRFLRSAATRCTDWGEIWREGVDLRSTLPRQISPQSVQGWGLAQKLKILLKFRIQTPRRGISLGRLLPNFQLLCTVSCSVTC